jgi:hypothetical protein
VPSAFIRAAGLESWSHGGRSVRVERRVVGTTLPL